MGDHEATTTGRLFYNNNSTLLQGEYHPPRHPSIGNPWREDAKQHPPARAWRSNARLARSASLPAINRGYISLQNGYDSDMLDPKTYKLINTTGSLWPGDLPRGQLPR